MRRARHRCATVADTGNAHRNAGATRARDGDTNAHARSSGSASHRPSTDAHSHSAFANCGANGDSGSGLAVTYRDSDHRARLAAHPRERDTAAACLADPDGGSRCRARAGGKCSGRHSDRWRVCAHVAWVDCAARLSRV